ncbi:GNAT family N-acetyltransferase [Arthrobacter caoxuetaonis]|uniref:GNAT family N-acetyltransferase n=1 Tax=Arthrobacter caoxuetaonis TaxID=2886935 RepID=A0A9X1MFD0_9MICC|nr:GNAT family N-acetyltransferase [Arthrobacter caoxuetaonis]MCC3298988.1 GNAT family N-acetyltransferase [Arthrobacter caoxuetaonis]USQ58671.1 GNAT family N-acetyltransferase [Arthrobacter caoxuetaonis]
MEIVPYSAEHREPLLALSLRAWEPVFPLLKSAVPVFVYESFYPDGWRSRQSSDLEAILDDEPDNIDVALIDKSPAGWVCTRLHPEDSMGEVYVLTVDPVHQGTGVGRALVQRSIERARAKGMRMVMVETGDDPGHSPARQFYEGSGFERWPVARYFKDISGETQ